MSEDRGYLVVSRREYERIYITAPDGSTLEIVSLPKKNGQNRIGVEAPKAYKVDRDKEVHEARQAELV